MSYLKVVVIGEEKIASNDNKYKVVTFQELSQFVKLPSGTREVKSNAKPAKRVLWEGQDGLYDGLSVEDITFGQIKKFDVAKYAIGEGDDAKEVSTFTGVQFKGETDSSTCGRYGHKMIDTVEETPEIIVNKTVTVNPEIIVVNEPAI